MFDPWGMLAGLPGWRVVWWPVARRGLTRWADRLVLLDPGMRGDQERAVVTHELVHAARGPVPGWMQAREEAAVSAIAACLLVDVSHLMEAVAWSRVTVEIADELRVDAATVRARVAVLTAQERAAIDARLELIVLP